MLLPRLDLCIVKVVSYSSVCRGALHSFQTVSKKYEGVSTLVRVFHGARRRIFQISLQISSETVSQSKTFKMKLL